MVLLTGISGWWKIDVLRSTELVNKNGKVRLMYECLEITHFLRFEDSFNYNTDSFASRSLQFTKQVLMLRPNTVGRDFVLRTKGPH